MKIEEQVLSIEQMQHLKELGVEVEDTALCWAKWSILTAENKWDESYRVCFSDEDYKFSIPTLTLQEILEMLPEEIIKDGKTYSFYIIYPNDGVYEVGYTYCLDDNLEVFCSKKLFMAVYEMLCWVAENGYLNASNSMSLNKN